MEPAVAVTPEDLLIRVWLCCCRVRQRGVPVRLPVQRCQLGDGHGTRDDLGHRHRQRYGDHVVHHLTVDVMVPAGI